MRSRATRRLYRTGLATLGVVALTLGAGAAGAQELAADAASLEDGVEIVREATELREVITPRPDPDFVDTVLAFNNPGPGGTTVACVGYNGNGRAVGRAWARIPANGLRLILASDISNDRDFLGSAQCKARSRVLPAAYIVGGGLTDTAARVARNWNDTFIRFPVVVHY